MKTLKIFQILFITVFCLHNAALAQRGLTLDLGGGISQRQKDAYINKSTTYGGRLYVPLTRKGWDGTIKGGISVGLLANFWVVDPQIITGDEAPKGLNVGGTGVTSSVFRGPCPYKPGFKNGLGLQVNLHAGSLVASPFITVGQDKQGANGAEVIQDVTFNGKTERYILSSAMRPDTKVLAFTPGFRIGYRFSKVIGLWASGQYTTGGDMTTTNTQFVPNGNPDQNGNYTIMQLQQGQIRPAEATVTPYKNVGFSGGISFSFGGKGGGKGDTAKIPDGSCRCCFKNHFKHGLSEGECCATNGGATKPTDLQLDQFQAWDGTLGGIFVGQAPFVFVPNLDVLVTTINKGGKGKAKKTKIDGKDYIVIEQQAKDSSTLSYFEVGTGSPMCIPVPDKPTITCRNKYCSNCGPVADVTGILRCKCFSAGPDKLCFDVSMAYHLSDFVQSPNLSDLTILSNTDGSLSPGSITNINNLVIAQMPDAQVKCPKLVTEKKKSYLLVPVVRGKDSFTLVSEVMGTGGRRTVSGLNGGIWSVMMYCQGAPCGSTSCYAIEPQVTSGVVVCPCASRTCSPTFGKMVGWQTE